MNRLMFEKTGDSVYISHLDLIRIFQRSFRRAGMLLQHSQGYTPHAYVSIMLPLSVGVSSECEIIDFEMDDSNETPLDQIPELLNRSMPDGIRVKKFYTSSRKPKELVYLRAKVTLEYDNGVPKDALEKMEALFAKDEILVDKKTKSGAIAQQNIKEMLPEYHFSADSNTVTIDCIVCAQNPSLNPMQLVKAIELNLPELAPDFASCHRIAFLDRDCNRFE